MLARHWIGWITAASAAGVIGYEALTGNLHLQRYLTQLVDPVAGVPFAPSQIDAATVPSTETGEIDPTTIPPAPRVNLATEPVWFTNPFATTNGPTLQSEPAKKAVTSPMPIGLASVGSGQ